jgi:hypothetical protein
MSVPAAPFAGPSPLVQDEGRRSAAGRAAGGSASRLRWSVLALFPLGWLLTWQAYADPFGYAVLTAVSAMACALLLTRLRGPVTPLLPSWIILGVFLVGYYLKFFWMTSALQSGAEWPIDVLFLGPARSSTLMFRVYESTTWGFVTFCVTAWILLGRRDAPVRAREASALLASRARQRLTRMCMLLLVLLLPFMLVTGYVQLATGLGIAGAAGVSLPYKLSGVIIHSRAVLIPALLLLLVWVTDQHRLRLLHVVSFAALLVHGLMQMLLLSSRGALIHTALPVLFLWLNTGRFTPRRRVGLLALAIVVAWLHPIISDYRFLRATASLNVMHAFSRAAEANGDHWATVTRGAANLVGRVSGSDAFLYAARVEVEKPTLKNVRYYLFNPNDRSLARIYTQDLAGYGRKVLNHLNVPGILGAFYLIGGNVAVVLGIFLWTVFWQVVWAALRRSRLRSFPVAASSLLLVLLMMTSEGDVDGLPIRAVLYGLAILVCEFFVRLEVSDGAGATLVRAGPGQRPPPFGARWAPTPG